MSDSFALSTVVRIGLFIAGKMPWRRWVPTLAARLFGAMSVRAQSERKRFFDGSGSPVYTLTQAWITNATRLDLEDVRARLIWKRRGSGQFEGLDVYGIWHDKIASGLSSYPGVRETVDLPSNGDDRHLGLAVRSARTLQVYSVCTQT